MQRVQVPRACLAWFEHTSMFCFLFLYPEEIEVVSCSCFFWAICVSLLLFQLFNSSIINILYSASSISTPSMVSAFLKDCAWNGLLPKVRKVAVCLMMTVWSCNFSELMQELTKNVKIICTELQTIYKSPVATLYHFFWQPCVRRNQQIFELTEVLLNGWVRARGKVIEDTATSFKLEIISNKI